MGRIFAAADIGSNTVHLLVAEYLGDDLRRLTNESVWHALGETVGRFGCIPPDEERGLITTLKQFRKSAGQHRAEKLYVFATEAMRRASNHADLLKKIRDQVGVKVDLITGEREAALSLRGALLDSYVGEHFLFLEAGGGSIQVCEVRGKNFVQSHSLPLGTGILRSKFDLRQPPSDAALSLAEAHLQEHFLQLNLPKGLPMLTCGGVSRGLMRALHPDGERVIRQFEIDYLVESLLGLHPVVISQRFNVKPRRAETLNVGALIYQCAMQSFGATQFTVSEFGVREGAILEMAQGKVKQ